MIESIAIANLATFASTPEVLSGLSKFNYIFGSNGTGKTSISRLIADETKYSTSKVRWKAGTRLQPMVYNQDFVERNYNQSTELRGVFTLGEKNVDTINRINVAKAEVDEITRNIETLTYSLQGADGTGGKKGEVATLEERLKVKCWEQKQRHDAKFQGAFEGYRGSSERFKAKVLQEYASNSEPLLTLSELEKKAETVFGPTPSSELAIPALAAVSIEDHESNPILKKRVIGKEDVDVAAMINKLGNSDWVRAGRVFYDVNEKVCPFCQQSTTDEFARSLEEYFDETFETDGKAIDDLAIDYKTDSHRLQQQVASIVSNPPRALSLEKLKAQKELFDSIAATNLQRLADKQREPSHLQVLDPIGGVIATIQALIDEANAEIARHNKMVANLSQERKTLTAQVWQYLVGHELKQELAAYKAARTGLDKAVGSITSQIETANRAKLIKAAEIRDLERQTTSIQPTIDGINLILSLFGFQGFALAKAPNGMSYKLVRVDGSDAKGTLSEGEKSFVTFLYFYHLLKGSSSESGVTTDRIVVFDDPVSSLDSDILFIVGSLIKGLFNEVRTGKGLIKQVFILTHNVYFHKEVTFNPKRQVDKALAEETFWVVRKSGLISKVDRYPSNPIKTSYDLLWSELRKPERPKLTIQNTLRRILENYFRIVGGVDPDKICEKFEGKDKIICRSLFSWVNDGSHSAMDDLYASTDDSLIEAYLKVFRMIFDKEGHLGHYNMMMGDQLVDAPDVRQTA